MTNFLVELFKLNDPMEGVERKMTARELIELGYRDAESQEDELLRVFGHD